MRPILAAALAFATVLPAAPIALAQAPTTQPARPGAARPGAVQPGTAQVAGTPGTGGTRTVETRSPDIEAAVQRAQKQADARAKAWDTKMKRMMGSVCSGC